MANYVSLSALDGSVSFSDLRIFADWGETSSNGSDFAHPMPDRFSFHPDFVDMDDASHLAAAAPRAPLGEITNIANADHDDEQFVSMKTRSLRSASRCIEQEPHEQYRFDMLKGMMRQERARPRPDPFYAQPNLQPWMRSRLIDWLVDVHFKFGYRQTTLFLTVSLVDRYLSHAQVVPPELQLIGVAAMLIATKFEEVPEVSEPPSLAELVYITDGLYSNDDIVDTECAILATLGFEVAYPTAAHFLLHFCDASLVNVPALAEEDRGISVTLERQAPTPPDAAWFALELALLDSRMLERAPSELAAAAFLLGRRITGEEPEWPVSCRFAAGYSTESLELSVSELLELLEAAPRQSYQAVGRKYCQVLVPQRSFDTHL